MRTIFILFASLLLSLSFVNGQNKIIKGRVIDIHLLSGPYDSLVINDTTNVGKTDSKGFFQITIPDSINKLSIVSPGYEKTIVEFTSDCNELEVVIFPMAHYHLMSRRQVDKDRLKLFKQLPQIHKEAYDKGLFKMEKPCFKQEFVYLYNKKT